MNKYLSAVFAAVMVAVMSFAILMLTGHFDMVESILGGVLITAVVMVAQYIVERYYVRSGK